MTLSLNTLKPAKGAKKRKVRVGRGDASRRGSTAGRGTKGQRARTGGKSGLKLKGLKRMLLGFPKKRGFTSVRAEIHALRVGRVADAFGANAKVTVAELKKKGLLPKRAMYVKLVGGGDVKKPLIIVGIKATSSVKEAIEKAGGSFIDARRASKSTKSVKSKSP